MANEFIARNGLIAQNNSTVSGSLTVTAGITGSIFGSASYATTASYALTSTSASYALTSTSASFATNATTAATASYANNFTVAGTLTAQTLVVQTITSSIVYSSGSNIFGNALANTQTFTGSMYQTGSVAAFMGNVGIGTTNPTARLEIPSASSGTTILVGRAVGNSSIKALSDSAGGILALDSAGTGNGLILNHYTSDNIWMVTGGGNVGINTSSPSYKLDVSGSGRFTGGLSLTSENPQLTFTDTTSGEDDMVLSMNGDYLEFLSNALRNIITVHGETSAYSGSVGIGTSAPQGKLSVDGGDIRFNYGNTAANYYVVLNHNNSYDGGIIWQRNNSSDWQMVNATNGDFWMYSYGTSTVALTLQKSSGNVGIGTTSPSNTLQVVGGVTATSFTGSFSGSLTAPGSTTQVLYNNGGAIAAASNFVFSGSNVGIGTASPVTQLQVVGGYISTKDNAAYGGAFLEGGSGVSYFGSLGSDDIQLYTGGATKVTIKQSSGNVGIGTTTPTQGKLVVNGGVYATSFTGSLFGTASYATNALSASYSLNTTSASYANNATSASYAATASYAGAYLPLAGGTMAGTLQMSNQILAFDQSGVRSWGVQASGGELNFTSGDSAGVFDFGTSVNVTGTLTATVKSFIIDHPTKVDKKLQYGVLEGPEHSVYVRGKLKNTNYIPLPDYWHALVHQDSITVTITAIGKKQDIWVNEVTEHGIYLGYEGNTIEYFYSVFAERKDIDKLVTEFDKEV